jgi:hypothetical protein
MSLRGQPCSCRHAGVPAIKAEIYDSIARDFAGAPVAVDVMARRHTRADSEQQGLQVGSSVISNATRVCGAAWSAKAAWPCKGIHMQGLTPVQYARVT